MSLRKAILIFLGTLFVGLGVLGMLLPLLPTTVFLLLAAYCYSHSSDRFHNWLLNNRLFGGYIKNYRSGRGISVRQKVTTLVLLWLSIGLSIWLLDVRFWPTLFLVLVAAGVTLHIVLIRTDRGEVVLQLDEQAPDITKDPVSHISA